jgi:predicted ATPase
MMHDGQRVAPLRGRAAQVAVIDDLITGARGGGGAVLVLEGRAGVGKTRLLDEVAARASCAGVRTLTGTPPEHQRSVPLSTLRATLPDLTGAAAEPVTDDEVYWALRDVRAAVAGHTSAGALCVCIDDVYDADTATLSALQLLTGPPHLPVLWALAVDASVVRPDVRDTLAAITAAGQTAVHHLDLPRLGAADVARVVEDIVGGRPGDCLLRMAAGADGNPAAIAELLAGLADEHRLSVCADRVVVSGPGLPQRFADLGERRFHRLSPIARETVHVASVLPRTFPVALLVKVLDRNPAHVLAGVREAVQSDLLAESGDHMTFRQEWFRLGLQRSMPVDHRYMVQRHAAAALLAWPYDE